MNEGIIEVLLADIWFQCHSGWMILVPRSTVNEGFTNRISCATVFSRQSLLGQSTSMLITLITLSGGQEHNVLTITTKDGIYLSTTVSVPTAKRQFSTYVEKGTLLNSTYFLSFTRALQIKVVDYSNIFSLITRMRQMVCLYFSTY